MHRGQKTIAIATALLLCACTPGASMDSSDYTVIPITPELVAQQQAERHAQPIPSVPPPRKSPEYAYRIGPGDTLSFRLSEGMGLGDAASAVGLSAQPVPIKVEADGNANFPLIGSVKSLGRTTAELRSDVERKLRRYFKSPRFELQVQEFHSGHVTVSGAVKKPGVQYLGYEPLTATRAVELAGGAEPAADLESTTVIHTDGTREEINLQALLYRGDASQQRVLADGDTLLLPENHRNRVFLMGEAMKPGALYIKAGKLSLTEALNDPQGPVREAQGPNTQTASIGNIYVIRGAMDGEADPSQVRIYRLDTSVPVSYAVADRFMLQPRDVIYISPAAITEWHRFLSQLLPANFGISKGIQ